MVGFVDRRLLGSMERLLCMLMNLLICGWGKEPTKGLTPCDLN
jgi:hypothetical protein